MIRVTILQKGNISLGFKISGHALSREEIESTTGDAYDMICNSVSVLSQSAVIGMQEVLKLPIKYEINDGFLSLDLTNLKNEDIEKGQVLLLTFVNMFGFRSPKDLESNRNKQPERTSWFSPFSKEK